MLNGLKSEPLQIPFFELEPQKTKTIVNVASVKQLSPFRYPGGKTWLVPVVLEWLKNQCKKPTEFIEVFAGGGIIGLTVAYCNLANHVTMVELDPDVSAVWHTILSDDATWLARSITEFNLTVQSVEKALGTTVINTRERLFRQF